MMLACRKRDFGTCEVVIDVPGTDEPSFEEGTARSCASGVLAI